MAGTQGAPPGGDKKAVTHVTTRPNAPALTPFEKVKVTLGSPEQYKQILGYFLNNEEEARRFQIASMEYIRKVPGLLNCKKDSLIMALITAAQFRFLPSGAMGEAFIIPYKEEAKFQIGYQGIVTLLYRTQKVLGITAEIIFENDKFEYEEGLNSRLVHVPAFGKPRGKAIGVYTVAQIAGGGKTFKVMDRDAVMAIKGMSKAGNKPDSPWNSGDPEKWMWKKTCLIQHAKLLPKTPDLQRAIELDYEGSGLEKARLDAAGPATAKALHAPAEEPATTPVEEEKCAKGLHPKSEVDADGDCKSCVADALTKDGGIATID